MNAPAAHGQARRVCVVGAGLGGLALAIRLQAAGLACTLVEARETPGGGLRSWQRDGFVFSSGPAQLADAAPLRELWGLSGLDLADDLSLLEVAPVCRFSWTDGVNFDLSADQAALAREVARLAPADLAGFEDFQRWSEQALSEGVRRLAREAQASAPAVARMAQTVLRNQGWRSAWSLVGGFVRNDKLRQALAFTALMGGANPMSAGAFRLLGQLPAPGGTAWWPEGGMGALGDAMARHFERLGGTIRLHDPVLQLHAIGNRVSEVETQSGWREHFDAVASNADLVHTYRDLLHGTARGTQMARRLASRRHSPGLFTVHFALEGTWPGIPHAMVLFGPRFAGLFEDIFEHGVLPADMTIMLSHPSLTDPSLAPPGKSVFSASVPVANLGKLPIDWETVGSLIEGRVIDEIGRRLIPDIRDRIITRFHYSPRDLALDLNAHLGSAWGLEPSRLQSGPLRPGNRDAGLANVYLVGSGTHPGAGTLPVLAGARLTANLMLETLR